jgi:hypothetical protein
MRRKNLFVLLAVVQMFTFVHCVRAEEARTNDIKSLQGLTGLAVVMGKFSEDVKKINITSKDIQEIAEMKLKMAGIKVLSREERLSTPGAPYLYLRISIKVTDDGFVYGSTKIQVEEEACLSRKQMCGTFITWDKGSLFSVGIDRANQIVKDSINEDMDIFLNDYFTANSKTKPVQQTPQKAK